MLTLRCALVSLYVSFLAAGSLQADPITIANNSFELSTGYNGGSPGTVPGWAAPSGQGTYGQTPNATSLFTSGLSGNNAIYIGGQLAQVTSATFQTGATYTFTVDVGHPLGAPNGEGGFVFGFRNADNSGFVSGGSQFVGDYNIDPILNGTFQTFNVTYTATATDNGNPIGIGFNDYYYSPSGQSGISNYYLDNVNLSTSLTVVPEPATYFSGFLCLLAFALVPKGRGSLRSLLR